MTERFVSFFLAVFLIVALTGCNDKPSMPLRIGTNFWLGYEPLYLARELGYFEPGTAHIVEYPSSSEVIRAFRNQVIDGAALTLDEVLLLAQDGFTPKIVLVLDISEGGDVIVGRPPMHSVKDLKDRRIAVENGAVGAYLLSRALMLHGLKAGDVRVVPLEANEQTAAYQQNEVDAAVVCEPARSELLTAGATLLFDSSRIPGEIVDVLAIRADYLAKHGDTVKPLIRAWFRALEYVKQHRSEAIAHIGARQRITPAQIGQALDDLRYPERQEILAMLSGTTPTLPKSGENLMRVMLEQNLLRTRVNINAMLAPEHLEKMSP